MRFIRWSLLAFVFLAGAGQAGTNSWSPLGPYGGRVTNLVIDPTNAAITYASTSYTLFKSTDAGVTWQELTQDFGRFPIADLEFDPAHPGQLYVVGLGGGVFRTSDGGATFTRVTPVPVDAATVDGPWDVAISQDGNTIYYSTISGQFFRSTDGGATFTARTTMPSANQRMALDPANSARHLRGDGPEAAEVERRRRLLGGATVAGDQRLRDQHRAHERHAEHAVAQHVQRHLQHAE